MKINTCFTPTEACTLIAHQAVSTLDAVQTEIPPCMKELRTAVEAMAAVHDLGKDGAGLAGYGDRQRRAVCCRGRQPALPDRYGVPDCGAGRGGTDGFGVAAV